MKERSTTYLQRYSEIIKIISESCGIPIKDVEEMIDYFFFTFNKFITDPRMPKIRISNLGTFKPTIGKINKNLWHGFKYYRLGLFSREKMVQRIQAVWEIRERLKKENRGIHTWKEWRDKYKTVKNNEGKKESQKQSVKRKSA